MFIERLGFGLIQLGIIGLHDSLMEQLEFIKVCTGVYQTGLRREAETPRSLALIECSSAKLESGASGGKSSRDVENGARGVALLCSILSQAISQLSLLSNPTTLKHAINHIAH